MTTSIAVETTDRLVKLLRLIFSTDKPGEIVAAVTAARRVLDSNECDAHWLADAFERGAAPAAVTPDDESGERDDRSAAWFCFHRRRSLSPKEAAFIANIVERTAPLTSKQRKWLHDIVDRLEAA
jgi:hypothetical protein